MLGKQWIVTKTSKFKGAIRESILAGRMHVAQAREEESNESESVGTPPSVATSRRASPSVIAEENV